MLGEKVRGAFRGADEQHSLRPLASTPQLPFHKTAALVLLADTNGPERRDATQLLQFSAEGFGPHDLPDPGQRPDTIAVVLRAAD